MRISPSATAGGGNLRRREGGREKPTGERERERERGREGGKKSYWKENEREGKRVGEGEWRD